MSVNNIAPTTVHTEDRMAGTREASKKRKRRLTAKPGAPLKGGGRTKPLESARRRAARADQRNVAERQRQEKGAGIRRRGGKK
jgi:hypothetical protein